MKMRTPKLIVVPTDFSRAAASALRYATVLASRFDAHLLVLHADTFVQPVDFMVAGAGAFSVPREELIEAARERLQHFAEMNITAAVPYDVRNVIGAPARSILSQVAECGADLIVMGTHGRSDVARLLFGSVTEEMMQSAPVPVIAVHEETPASAARIRVVLGPRATAEDQAAIDYCGVLADPAEGRFVEAQDGADLVATAQGTGADVIALGVNERTPLDPIRRNAVERIVQKSICPVLAVNARAGALECGGLTPLFGPAVLQRR